MDKENGLMEKGIDIEWKIKWENREIEMRIGKWKKSRKIIEMRMNRIGKIIKRKELKIEIKIEEVKEIES